MTEIGLGCVKLGSIAAGHSEHEAIRLVHHAMDRGVTYFDTADSYGAGVSERLLGRALSGRWAGVTVATKGGYLFRPRSPLEQRLRTRVGSVIRQVQSRGAPSDVQKTTRTVTPHYGAQDFSPAYLTQALDASMRRLRTDHIDVYQLHAPQAIDRDELTAWSAQMVSRGRIGRFGVGAETLAQARWWSEAKAVSCVQLPFGVLDPEAGDELIPAIHRLGKSVIARGVLGAGLLRDPALLAVDRRRSLVEDLRRFADRLGASLVQIAMWFVLSRVDVDVVLVGVSSPAHLDEVVSSRIPPDDQTSLSRINDIVAQHRVRDDVS